MNTSLRLMIAAGLLHNKGCYSVLGFSPGLRSRTPFRSASTAYSSTALGLPTQSETAETQLSLNEQSDDVGDKSTSSPVSSTVRAPLRFIGPYPCLGLHFPDLATSSQRGRNVSGISLDFVIDTAANTNTINAQVAKELGLEIVGAALPGLGAGGALSGGDKYMLGDCELDGLPKEEKFLFMTSLTASALPVASPAAAGLLSSAFLNCFEGGVEFDWGSKEKEIPPSITFYSDEENLNVDEMIRASIKQLPVTLLPSVTLKINGVDIPALFDTGSPITVLNAQAASATGIETMEGTKPPETKNKNPFSAMADNFKAAQAAAQAVARGDILAIAGSNGERVELLKSDSKLSIEIGGEGQGNRLGESHVYVGDLPGLAALGGLSGESSPPVAVLGMDVLRLRPRLIYRGQNNEVYL